MKITLLANCGLAIEQNGNVLLIDTPNGSFAQYEVLPESELDKICSREAPYEYGVSLAYTHKHSDHYSSAKVQRVAEAGSLRSFFAPVEQTPWHGVLEDFGGFRLEYFRIEHTPLPPDLMWPHCVYLIEADGKRIYVTGDAAPDAPLHSSFLAGRRCDCAFWNGQYLSHPETRVLLHQTAKRNYIYHIPADEPDVMGIRRKAERNMQRVADDLYDTELLEKYPTVIEL